MRCTACHLTLASFGKRAEQEVAACTFCLRIARHDGAAIARFVREERATQFDVDYVRMRVRSAIHYAWMKKRRWPGRVQPA